MRNGALVLTKSGRKALEEPPAAVLLDLWKSWINGGIIDEFSRVDAIKGQKGKGRAGFTPPRNRRVTVAEALAECPVGKWVETAEFSRYMRATGRRFEVTDDPWSLYLCEPEYGSLGYDGFGGWNILQERYLLCLLFEYAAPLGLIDVAYEHPTGARPDYAGQWGADDLIFLSRYDGLKYIRLTPLGAYILGLARHYAPPQVTSKAALSILPKRQIRLVGGELSPDEILLIERYADRDGDRLWSLNEAKAIKAVEAGSRVGEFRSFLAASDPQPLPETVESFLVSVEQRGTACRYQGRCAWVPW